MRAGPCPTAPAARAATASQAASDRASTAGEAGPQVHISTPHLGSGPGAGGRAATSTTFGTSVPFIERTLDSVSTSPDTDPASSAGAQRLVRYEVDPASVRAEEWINAFDYQYDPPEDGGSFTMATDVFRHPLDDRMHMARIGFQAPELLDATPLNVTLVLDASGSMREGNRVETAREAANSILNSLNPRDRVA